jgi:hypothetical protein
MKRETQKSALIEGWVKRYHPPANVEEGHGQELPSPGQDVNRAGLVDDEETPATIISRDDRDRRGEALRHEPHRDGNP